MEQKQKRSANTALLRLKCQARKFPTQQKRRAKHHPAEGGDWFSETCTMVWEAD